MDVTSPVEAEAPSFATEGFAEVQPYYGPLDELEVGSMWRLEKLKDFEWKIKCAGLQDDPEMMAVLDEMRRETIQLEQLAAEEKEQGRKHWWCDGEYDDARGEEANDRGMESYQLKEWGPAFDHYTEAIRLAPGKAAFHNNRAAVALKLGRHSIAAADGAYAAQLDPRNTRARVRGARGHLLSGDPARAVFFFEQALALDPNHKAAAEGLVEARVAAEAKAAAQAAERASAQRGERPPLPAHPLAEADAADLLIAADEMLRANPQLEAAKCFRVEALVHCRRYDDAAAACDQLLPGSVDAMYLQAELRWRRNEIAGARLAAEEAVALRPDSVKCVALLQRLNRIHEQTEAAAAAMDDGRWHVALEQYSLALAWDVSGATAFTAWALSRRAAAAVECSRVEDALRDLDRALLVEPFLVDALVQRATLYKDAGRMEECFLDLRKAQQVAPEMPGLWTGLADAANRCMHRRYDDDGTVETTAAADAEFYRLLGISSGAAPKQVTKGYRTMAAKWHPDKWAGKSDKQQKMAEEMFKKISAAYVTLKDPISRRAYNNENRGRG